MSKQYIATNYKTTIHDDPDAMHAFNPVSDSKICEVNKEIDGKIWKYLAYASNIRGSEIKLYYTDDLDSEWISYSKNPILDSKNENQFRWPNTVWDGKIFHMFLDNLDYRQIEHWTSEDGIHFVFNSIIHIENRNCGERHPSYGPFVWLNPNDNKWYLYWRDANEEKIKVNISDDLNRFERCTNIDVINSSESFPSLTASASILFCDGIYWLLLEGEIDKIWKTFAFYSESPISNFKPYGEILSNGDACGMQYYDSEGKNIYLYISNCNGNGWRERTYQVKIT